MNGGVVEAVTKTMTPEGNECPKPLADGGHEGYTSL